MIETLFLLGRILYGGFFILSSLNHFMKLSALAQYASSKKVPWPKFSVIFSGLLILLGGLGILFGVYTQYAAWLLVAFLVGVSSVMHNFWALKDPMQKQIEMGNFMKNMALLGAALMLLQLQTCPYLLYN